MKEKKIMSKLYDSVDYSNLKFEYVGPTKDVSLYEYKDSKELFNAIKNKQNEFLNKLPNIKIGKKTIKQKETINNLEKFYKSREKVINFLETILKCYLMLITIQNIGKMRGKDLRY